METPYWINGDYKWYVDKKYQDYLINEQADNLPPLKNLGVFRVVNEIEKIDDYVLIDNKQQPIRSYKHSSNGAEQLEAFINILKVSKHFEECETKNVGRKKRKYEK